MALIREIFTPSTNASSSCTVSDNSGFQMAISTARTTPTLIAIIPKSDQVTASMSPKSHAFKSTRIPCTKLINTKPSDSALCEMMPSRASLPRRFWRCESINKEATIRVDTSMPIFTLIVSSMPSATPSIALCESVSPKYAIRRQRRNAPRGPAINAIAMPARMARTKKSSMRVLSTLFFDNFSMVVISMLAFTNNNITAQFMAVIMMVGINGQTFGG